MSVVVLLYWACACALFDARARRIPNWLVSSGLLIALLHLLLTQTSLSGASPAAALSGLLLGLLLSAPGYGMGRMGAGDVKMLLVLGLASSHWHVLLAVGGAGIGMLLWSLLADRLWPCLPLALQRALALFAPAQRQRLPYAPFLIPGLLIALCYAP